MAVKLTFPTAEEEELLRRFTVNKNYLQALRGFLRHSYGRGDDIYPGLRDAVIAHRPYQRISGGKTDVEEVRRWLVLAWASEMQLHLPDSIGQAPVVAVANSWAPVHAYYTAFGLLQAWFSANGITGTATDHISTLRTIASMIEHRWLFPEPWSLLAVGCPMRGETRYLNAPAGVDCAAHVEVLSVPVTFAPDPTFWPRYGTWLRTTREARLKAREEQWKAEHKKRKVSRDARTRIATSVAPTSLFDCFWRLRIKSNYGTIDPYLVSHIGQSDHLTFNTALRAVVVATAGLLELYIARRVGRGDFERIADDFIAQDASGLSGRLAGRLQGLGLRP